MEMSEETGSPRNTVIPVWLNGCCRADWEGMDIDALSWDRLTSFDQFHTRGLRRLGNRQHLPRRNRAKR